MLNCKSGLKKWWFYLHSINFVTYGTENVTLCLAVCRFQRRLPFWFYLACVRNNLTMAVWRVHRLGVQKLKQVCAHIKQLFVARASWIKLAPLTESSCVGTKLPSHPLQTPPPPANSPTSPHVNLWHISHDWDGFNKPYRNCRKHVHWLEKQRRTCTLEKLSMVWHNNYYIISGVWKHLTVKTLGLYTNVYKKCDSDCEILTSLPLFPQWTCTVHNWLQYFILSLGISLQIADCC